MDVNYDKKIHNFKEISQNNKVSHFKKDFLYGCLVVIPLACIIWIIDISVKILTDPVSKLIGFQLNNLNGLIISISLLWGIGFLCRQFVNKSIFPKFEATIIRLPIISIIYRSMKQIAKLIINKHHKFIATVYIEYPSKGIWSLGFITNQRINCLRKNNNEPLLDNPISVFIPSTPNPANGVFVFVNKGDVVDAKMSVEDGIKCLMSAGMIAPNIGGIE